MIDLKQAKFTDKDLEEMRKYYSDHYDKLDKRQKEEFRLLLKQHEHKFSNDGKYKYLFNGEWIEMPIVCTGCAVHPPKKPLEDMKTECAYIKYIFPLCQKNHCEGNKDKIDFCSLGCRKDDNGKELIYYCNFKWFEVRVPKDEDEELSLKSC